MIAISTITQDISGSVVLYTDADFRENSARVSRVKTLDGGVVITHSGVADGDRTIDIDTKISKAQADSLWYIFNNYTSIHISIGDGFFIGAISNLSVINGKLKMSIMIENREDA